MKRLLKKVPLRKKESERTKVEKIVRDVVFFAIVIFAAIMTYAYLDAKAQLVEAESDAIIVAMNI